MNAAEFPGAVDKNEGVVKRHLFAVTCPQVPHTSYYDIRTADDFASGEPAAAVAVGKWETRSVFQGGDLPPSSAHFILRHPDWRVAHPSTPPNRTQLNFRVPHPFDF
jgi:hypothetical protein